MELWLMFSVVVALLAFMAWMQWQNHQERRDLLNRIIARNPAELRALDANVPPRDPPPIDPDWLEYLKHGDPVGT